MIKGAHIIFRPGKTLAELLKILSYQQVQTRAVAQTGGDSGKDDKDPDEGSGDSGETPDPAA